jgi:hypothetical protein
MSLNIRPSDPNQAAKVYTSPHRLARETFKTSRLLDFCSERELTKQIGHGVAQWPLVILKELVDNALDAAEEASIAPAIGVEVADGAVTITDNGPGIPAETVAGVLDFSVRVSSREAYVSPTRGAQGNALKTIVAMAYFTEPHTEHSIGLGTIAAREYLESVNAPTLQEAGCAAAKIGTRGPEGCFGAVLFIEKEGFLPLFEAVHLAERFDLAIMSTKGMSLTAARSLIDDLCQDEVPLLALHDFDKTGMSIAATLTRDTRRFVFTNVIEPIDLGLRLTDVQELGLEASAEDVFDHGSVAAKLHNLRLNGATDEEAQFLLRRRVELNALTSDQLVAFIECKLIEHGIQKVVPDADLLRDAYQLHVKSKRIEEIVAEAIEDFDDGDITAPDDLSSRVAAYLKEHPEVRWDAAVAALVEDDMAEPPS